MHIIYPCRLCIWFLEICRSITAGSHRKGGRYVGRSKNPEPGNLIYPRGILVRSLNPLHPQEIPSPPSSVFTRSIKPWRDGNSPPAPPPFFSPPIDIAQRVADHIAYAKHARTPNLSPDVVV